MTKDQIKAVVLYNWDHIKRCKFYSGDEVIVVQDGRESHLTKHVGKRGKVVAVTCANDGRIRGNNTRYGRGHTRYYVQFADGQCTGFHSHYIATPQQILVKKLDRLVV